MVFGRSEFDQIPKLNLTQFFVFLIGFVYFEDEIMFIRTLSF